MVDVVAKRGFWGLIVVGALGLLGLRMEAQELKVGRTFPNLVLPRAQDGLPDSVAAYRGKKTVLHVFASW